MEIKSSNVQDSPEATALIYSWQTWTNHESTCLSRANLGQNQIGPALNSWHSKRLVRVTTVKFLLLLVRPVL